MKVSPVQVEACMIADRVTTSAKKFVCESCQGECYTLEVWALDILRPGPKRCLLFVEHVPTLAQSLSMTASFQLSVSRKVAAREAEIFFREHQTSLF